MLKLVEAFTKFTDIPKKDKRALCTVRTHKTPPMPTPHTHAHTRTHSPGFGVQSIRDVFMVEGEQPAAVAEAEAEAGGGGKGAKKGATKESEKESGRVFDLKGLLEVKSAVRDAPTKPAFGKKKKRYRCRVCVVSCRVVSCVSRVSCWKVVTDLNVWCDHGAAARGP
jgi:hypothetical protein